MHAKTLYPPNDIKLLMKTFKVQSHKPNIRSFAKCFSLSESIKVLKQINQKLNIFQGDFILFVHWRCALNVIELSQQVRRQ